MSLNIVLDRSDVRNKEQDVHLDVLVFGRELTNVLRGSSFPWLSNSLPSLLRVVVDPFLKVGHLIFGKDRAFLPHNRIVEEHSRVGIPLLDEPRQ